ncbi:MAG: HAD-IIA family hydrolase [bacterium]
MTEADFIERLDSIKCFALDLDGTIYLGNYLFPYTKLFLDKVTETERDYIFLPNNSSLGPIEYVQKLTSFGLTVEQDQVYTSADATLEYLLNFGPGHRLCVMGTDPLIRFFESNGFVIEPDEPDALVLGSDLDFDYSRLLHAARLLKHGVPFFATHPDATTPIEDGDFMPDCGAISAALTASTGVEPIVLGKPSVHMIEGVLRRTGLGRSELAIIGDRLDTDILSGTENDVLSILVLTGETTRQALAKSKIKPDFVAPSLLGLIRYLDKKAVEKI